MYMKNYFKVLKCTWKNFKVLKCNESNFKVLKCNEKIIFKSVNVHGSTPNLTEESLRL